MSPTDVATWLQLGPLVEVQKNLRALRAQIRAAADDSSAVRRISYGVLHTDPTTAQRMFDGLKEPISVSAANCLGRYKCVLLRGKFDRVESHSSLSARARKLSATYVELSMSGHTPMIEEPANYAQTIRDLMR
jgi:pimeloyl-ACP methyl ester carboxylesterase